jgi:hypothetical protein
MRYCSARFDLQGKQRSLSQPNGATDIPKHLRYNVFFVEHAVFLLLFDSVHNPEAAHNSQLCSKRGVDYLEELREGDPVTLTVNAAKQVLLRLQQSRSRATELASSDPAEEAAPSTHIGQGIQTPQTLLTHDLDCSEELPEAGLCADPGVQDAPSTHHNGDVGGSASQSWLDFDDIPWEVDFNDFHFPFELSPRSSASLGLLEPRI